MISSTSSNRPSVASYDAGYEHTVEHWFELKAMVAEADSDRSTNLDRLKVSNTDRPRAMAQTAGA
jgi:hypothetical protein